VTPYHQDPDCTYYVADARAVLASLPEKSVHTVVTSPPYHNLRSYLDADHPDKELELGSEDTADCLGWARGERCDVCYICKMLAVFAAVWKVLRDDGSCWVNISDGYADKQRSGIPERFALGMQSSGWYWRDTIHLCKTSPMPESVRDRTTQAHEYLYLFSKRPRYFWDAEAVKESLQESSLERGYSYRDPEYVGPKMDGSASEVRANSTWHGKRYVPSGRNPRSWMLVSPEPSNGTSKHYATFVGGRTIPSFAIRAGSSEYGVCGECGAPWEREVSESLGGTIGHGWNEREDERLEKGNFKVKSSRGYRAGQTLGFRPTCSHADAPVVPATVLDPFSGSGTSAVTARQLGRRSIYVDLSASYADAAITRLAGVTPMLPLAPAGARAEQGELL